MARASTPAPTPQPAHLTVEQMVRGIERIQKRIDDVNAFDPRSVTRRFGPEVKALEASIDETLQKVFGNSTPEYTRYSDAANLDRANKFYSRDLSTGALQQGYIEGKENCVALLGQAIRGLQEEVAEQSTIAAPAAPTPGPRPALTRKVFFVLGHDEGARELMASFLRKANFEPVILHEKANQGLTIIEKVLAHGDVGFAVVLLTPDDVGSVKEGTPQPRARQNVLLELGYFVGRLGREHVCAMKRGDLEVPSDWQGVVNTEFDAHGGWRTALAKELEAAGHEIDWRKAMS